ncbi:MAG: Flp family type IVb pilin [Pirellulaceae bacterium]
MKNLLTVAKRFLKEEDAPTMVEYGLLVVFIALVVVVGATAFGTNLRNLFQSIATSLSGTTVPAIPTPGS